MALLGKAVCSQSTIVAGGMTVNVKIYATRSHSSTTSGDPTLPRDDYGNNTVCTVPIIVISYANYYFRYGQC